jgi:hypothetical protein
MKFALIILLAGILPVQIVCARTGISRFTSYLRSTENSSHSIKVSENGVNTVRRIDSSGCSSLDSVTMGFVDPDGSENICMVFVDTMLNRNVIIWPMDREGEIIDYNIYREGEIRGQYEMIGKPEEITLGAFVDTVADPMVRPWRYKITSIDSCGNESLLEQAVYHRTINFVWGGSFPESTFHWTSYEIEGVDDMEEFIGYYVIYRGPHPGNLAPIDTLSPLATAYTDTDPEARKQRLYYRVAAVFREYCLPFSSYKAVPQPYFKSWSNYDDNQYKIPPVRIAESAGPFKKLSVYPNPSSGEVQIRYFNPGQSPYRLAIYDLAGNIVFLREEVREGRVYLNTGEFSPGYYHIELSGREVYRGTLIVD